jgi:alkylation response protein AidB-like acyl-CoA dehydrogenase
MRESVRTAPQPPIVRARALAPLIEASADAIEAACELPPALLDALHDAAMFRTLLPRDLGGDELAPADYVEMIAVIAAADASTAWCIGQNSGCSMASAYMRPEIADEIWGKDPRAVLAWGAGPQGLAKVVDNGFVVTGSWSFASGCRHASWLGGHSRVQERDGTLHRSTDGEPVECTMLFPKDRAVVTANWKVIGLRGTGSDSYSVTELFVPEEYTVVRDTSEHRRQAGRLYKFSTTQLYACGFAAVALGIAQATLSAFKAQARERKQWASTRLLRESPVVQMKVALAEAKLAAARALLSDTLKGSWTSLQMHDADEMAAEQRIRIRLASTYAIHQAKEVVDVAYHEAGAAAIFDANPFERRLRDINAVTQQVQAHPMHFETVGAYLLGLSPPLRFA